MRFYSTPQSTLHGEVTTLAILETVVATGFSAWLVVHRGTLSHVVLGSCLAPLLLLRTDESTRLAFVWILRLYRSADEADRLPWRKKFYTAPPKITAFVLGIFFVRPISIAFTMVRRPLYSIRSIPQNWARVVLATDVCHPPEILPEMETQPSDDVKDIISLKFSKIWELSWWAVKTKAIRESWLLLPSLFLYVIIIFVPALLYRYSLKATAIVYLPILWILHDSLVVPSTLHYKLEDIVGSPLECLKRWYSWFVIIFLITIPTAIYFVKNAWWEQLSTALYKVHPATAALLSAFLPTAPSGLYIAGWHLARGTNAILTLVLFLWAFGKLREMKRGKFVNPDSSAAALNLWLLVRGLLTLYILACTLYIIIAAVTWRDLWPVHIRWVPK